MASQSYALRGRPSHACIPRSVTSSAPTSPSCTPWGCRRCSYAPEIRHSAVAAAPTSPSCAPQGVAVACTSGRRYHACAPQDPLTRPLPPRRRAHRMGPPPRACPRDPMPQPLSPRRQTIAAHWSQGSAAASCLLDPPLRVCPPDPPPHACSKDPPLRAPLGGGA
jgi:hypothetical protein